MNVMISELEALQSQPASGEAFFDRKEATALLMKRAGAVKGGYRQNIAIIGPRLIGKTSVITNFLHNITDRELVPISVEVKEETLESFGTKYMSSLLYHYLKSDSKEADPAHHKASLKFQELLELCRKSIPQTADSMEKVKSFLKRRHSEALNALLELPAVFSEETKKCCIVIFDEFHNLEKLGAEKPFVALSKQIMLQKNAFYIITSSSVSQARHILAEKLHLLFGNFEIIELEGFGVQASRDFLGKRLGGLKLERRLASFLAIFTGGSPFYLDLICTELSNLAASKKKDNIDNEIFLDAFERLLSSSRGILNCYFSALMGDLRDKERANAAEILLAISQGFKKANNIAANIQCGPKEAAKALTQITGTGLIARCGVFYFIPDKVFKLWLNLVYKRRHSAFLTALPDEGQVFKREFENFVAGFTVNENPLEHVQNLMRSFNNERVQIGDRNYKFMHFSRIETKSYSTGEDHIMATGSKYWICKVLQGEATENDVVSFAAKCRASRKEISKRVLFAFGGINECAGLVAKQEKILAIDLQKMNLISELYDKPFFVT